MKTLEWQETFNTGIEEVDNQHKQMLDFINQLGNAKSYNDKSTARSTLEGLSEYTISHFTFEESLMEEAGYAYLEQHKHVHQLLIQNVVEFRNRLQKGEDIYDELYAFLRGWLINHIQRDDPAYVKPVTAYLSTPKRSPKKEVSLKEKPTPPGWMSRVVGCFLIYT